MRDPSIVGQAVDAGSGARSALGVESPADGPLPGTGSEVAKALENEVMEIDPPDSGYPPTTAVEASVDWRRVYIEYLTPTLPPDRTEARRIDQHAKSFIHIDNELYKRSPSGIKQRCIPIEQGSQLLEDIHSGVCGHHAAPKTILSGILLADGSR